MEETDIVDELRKCSVCLGILVEPKVFPCHHTFCKSCVDSLPVHSSGKKCATCRKPAAMSDIKTDFQREKVFTAFEHFENQIRSAQDELSKLKPEHTAQYSPTCQLCDEDPVRSLCSDCQLYICNRCAKGHSKMAATKIHSVTSLKDLKQRFVDAIERRCMEENDKLVEVDLKRQKLQQLCEASHVRENMLHPSRMTREEYLDRVNRHFDSEDRRIESEHVAVTTYNRCSLLRLTQHREKIFNTFDAAMQRIHAPDFRFPEEERDLVSLMATFEDVPPVTLKWLGIIFSEKTAKFEEMLPKAIITQLEVGTATVVKVLPGFHTLFLLNLNFRAAISSRKFQNWPWTCATLTRSVFGAASPPNVHVIFARITDQTHYRCFFLEYVAKYRIVLLQNH